MEDSAMRQFCVYGAEISGYTLNDYRLMKETAPAGSREGQA